MRTMPWNEDSQDSRETLSDSRTQEALDTQTEKEHGKSRENCKHFAGRAAWSGAEYVADKGKFT